jgi:hypothetical protein
VACQIVPVPPTRPSVDHTPLIDEAIGRRIELEREIRAITGKEAHDICVEPLLEGWSRVNDLLEHVHDRDLICGHTQVFQKLPIRLVMQ